MIAQLLARLEPQRRHLTYLVGLLALTFVLASVMAYGAHKSESRRLAGGAREVHNAARNASRTWGSVSEQLLGSMVSYGAQLWSDPLEAGIPIDELPPVDAMCPVCREPVTPTVFGIDSNGNFEFRGAELSSVAAAAIAAHVASGGLRYVGSVRAAGIFVNNGGAVQFVAIYVLMDSLTNRPLRTAGFAFSDISTRNALAHTFVHAPLLPPILDPNSNNAEYFATRVVAGGATLLGGAEVGAGAGIFSLGSDSPDERMIFGADLEVGVRPERYSHLSANTQRNATAFMPVMMLAIMMVVIAMSLLLVRREEELVRLRAEFISSVSHELRTPLAQIRMFTETLLLGRVRSDVERRRSLEIIDQEARRLSALVENVLLFSRGEGGMKPRLSPQETPFADEIRRAVEGFGPLLRQHGADIRTELQENLLAAVDRDALRQIMINLIDNALKYGPSGQRVMVGVALFENLARVWVDDEGPGIPAADRDRVFGSFVRLQRDVDSKTAGSGIGLAVVRELARLHGGDCWVDEAPGGGARIVVQFPDAYLRSEPTANLSVAS